MSVIIDGQICKQKRLSLQIVECMVIMRALYGIWSSSTVSSIIIPGVCLNAAIHDSFWQPGLS